MQRQIGDLKDEREHAAWLGCTQRTLRRWRNEPDGLDYTTAGRSVLYKREWTLAWLEKKRTVKNPTVPAKRRRGRPPRTAQTAAQAYTGDPP